MNLKINSAPVSSDSIDRSLQVKVLVMMLIITERSSDAPQVRLKRGRINFLKQG